MKFIPTKIPEVFMIEPKVFEDDRGYFFESYRKEHFDIEIRPIDFIQDNESKSTKGVLRGLHYQLPPFAQSKLVRVIKGRVLDVAVDIRRGSPTFKQYVAVELSEENKRQILIPRGFAHGFLVLSDEAIFSYKVDNYYAPEYDRSIRYDDPDIAIDWGFLQKNIIVSPKDRKAPLLKDAELFGLEELY